MWEICPKILGGYEYLNPSIGKNYYFFLLKKYPQVCERCVPNRTHPNGRHKAVGGEVYIG